MSWQNLLTSKRLRKTKRIMDNDSRNEFESDFGRVIFSPAVRRMHDKTQVFPLTSDDNIHSRLTHSMEVMAVAYSIGIRLVENEKFKELAGAVSDRDIPIILKSAALVHDIGNPPFGHMGEESIKSFFIKYFDSNPDIITSKEQDDFKYFDGNAQGFRVLTKLQFLNDLYGLNLTKATLGAYLKYPNYKLPNKNKISTKKRGVFFTEKEYLESVASDCGLFRSDEIIRHPLSFLVEAADTICYRAMDIEDGYNKGWYSFKKIEEYFKGSSLEEDINKIIQERESDTYNIANFRLAIVRKLVGLVLNEFLSKYEEIFTGEYKTELLDGVTDDIEVRLKKFCIENIFTKRDIITLELTGDAVISGLLEVYLERILNQKSSFNKHSIAMMSKSIIGVAKLESGLALSEDFNKVPDYLKIHAIVDFISGMTDQYALDHYQRLNGQRII